MEKYNDEEVAAALRVIASSIINCEKMQPKFSPGSSQHTLLQNRIKALTIAKSLIANEEVSYSAEELTDALRPIASIISKCERGQQKFASGTPQHTRFTRLINAMQIAESRIRDEISEY